MGARSNSSAVTIPKLGPAPRMPQNRSACSSSLARTWRPSAVTSSTARRQSIARPSLRWRRPMPPPSVRPAMPVCETVPAVHARPTAWAASSSSARRAPPLQRATRRSGSTVTPRIRARSMITPSSQVECPGRLWPPLRTAIGRSSSRANRSAAATSSALVGRRIRRGPAVDHAVPDGARRVVGLVAGQDHVAREPVAEGLEPGRVEVSDGLVDHVQPPAFASWDESPGHRDPGQPDH